MRPRIYDTRIYHQSSVKTSNLQGQSNKMIDVVSGKNVTKINTPLCKIGQNSELKFKYEGLPNIGNTCFLNSILQLLFAAENFRQEIKSFSENFSEENELLHKIISLIYQDIAENTTSRGKNSSIIRNHLRKLTQVLRKVHADYFYHSQQDALDFLLLLLQKLKKENPKIIQLFEIEYLEKCNCKSEKEYLFKHLYLSYEHQMCMTCGKESLPILRSSPSYIIFISNNPDKIDFKRTIQMIVQKKFATYKTAVIYHFAAKILYNGNGSFGHYKAVRKSLNLKKEESIECIYDDNIVEQFNPLTRSPFKPQILLYEKYKSLDIIQEISEITHHPPQKTFKFSRDSDKKIQNSTQQKSNIQRKNKIQIQSTKLKKISKNQTPSSFGHIDKYINPSKKLRISQNQKIEEGTPSPEQLKIQHQSILKKFDNKYNKLIDTVDENKVKTNQSAIIPTQQKNNNISQSDKLNEKTKYNQSQNCFIKEIDKYQKEFQNQKQKVKKIAEQKKYKNKYDQNKKIKIEEQQRQKFKKINNELLLAERNKDQNEQMQKKKLKNQNLKPRQIKNSFEQLKQKAKANELKNMAKQIQISSKDQLSLSMKNNESKPIKKQEIIQKTYYYFNSKRQQFQFQPSNMTNNIEIIPKEKRNKITSNQIKELIQQTREFAKAKQLEISAQASIKKQENIQIKIQNRNESEIKPCLKYEEKIMNNLFQTKEEQFYEYNINVLRKYMQQTRLKYYQKRKVYFKIKIKRYSHWQDLQLEILNKQNFIYIQKDHKIRFSDYTCNKYPDLQAFIIKSIENFLQQKALHKLLALDFSKRAEFLKKDHIEGSKAFKS